MWRKALRCWWRPCSDRGFTSLAATFQVSSERILQFLLQPSRVERFCRLLWMQTEEADQTSGVPWFWLMMAFLDGIKMSLPAAVSHANYIVCRVDGGKKPEIPLNKKKNISFYCDGFFLWHPLMFVFFNVMLFLLQVYRHSYMASYSIYNIHTRWVFMLFSAVLSCNRTRVIRETSEQ